LALIAGGDLRSESLYNGVDYLIRSQRSDGGWNEDYCTGTGFPRVFYLSYTDYRNTFPLLALSTFTKAAAGQLEGRRQHVGDMARAAQAS
jgi:squalene-hopene/tetraprenyl-beta-curcumene cyclase